MGFGVVDVVVEDFVYCGVEYGCCVWVDLLEVGGIDFEMMVVYGFVDYFGCWFVLEFVCYFCWMFGFFVVDYLYVVVGGFDEFDVFWCFVLECECCFGDGGVG